MSEFLLEIGTEEIPARLVPGARRELGARFMGGLREVDLHGGVRVSVEATPRRLALVASGLARRQEDRVEVLRGPARRVAFDASGSPTAAGLGFARRVGVPVEDLDTAADGKLVHRRRIAGREAAALLAERLAGIVLGIPFPRSMYWGGKGSPRFIRPIRWIVALLDGQVVPFEIAGVQSGEITWGHRRLGTGPLVVQDADSYRTSLRENGVILSAEERETRILAQAVALLPSGSALRSNPGLLRTLVNETEFPTALLGSFDPGYLALPEEVLETVMLVHQKYFAVEDGSGNMTNCFVAVANSAGDREGVIRSGHERVLRARFNDARFFWDFDQRSSLDERVEDLEAVTFQASLGSYWAKTESNLRAAGALSGALGLDVATTASARRAVRLAKCDLTTEMVGEFPELQGKIGGLYAAAQGESAAVAEAVYDHYLPVGGAGGLPRSTVGRVASMADKLATLGGMFGLGLVPTGSKDPLALRRAAYAVIRIVMEGDMAVSLESLVQVADAGENASRLRAFLVDRLRYWLQKRGDLPADVVQAVLAASDEVPLDVLARARALDAVRATPDFEALAVSFKRIRNIVGPAGSVGTAVPDPSLLEQGSETELYDALEDVAVRMEDYSASHDYAASLREIARLRPVLDRYFDDVLVMAEDRALRRNRLAFLAGLLERLSTIADFTQIASGPRKR